MSATSEAGRTIGRYRVVSKIGSGGMGEVYLAADTELDRHVALKVLRAEAAGDADRVNRFVQEAKAASALNHPNILTVHEIGKHDGSRFITTEYIKGETLRDRFRGSPLTLRETLDITMQVAAALNAAHEAGIVYRDIKPENIMLRDDSLVKVLDFGLAKLAERPASVDSASEDATRAQINTSPGVVMGTANYMSPEQARGKATDARTDVWSLAIVLYEMLTRATPFAGETTNDSIAAILTKEPAPLDESVPLELQRIIKKSLQKKPDERYQTVKDLLIDVKNLKHELEFSEELERSHIPAFSKSTNVAATQSAGNATGMHDGAVSTQNSISQQPSSGEYIVSEIRQHKRGALAAVLGGLIVALVVGGAYFFWFASPAAAINSVAVIPFENTGGDPEQEYLSDGISDALINNLSQLPQLKVIARSSTVKYKGKEIDPQVVARELGVGAIVTGRVSQRGDNLNISVEMINAAYKTQMWGETYSRKIADAQTIQHEIARNISEKLRLKLSGGQEQQLLKQATSNPEAYQIYLNGEFHLRKAGTENLRKALQYYLQALALDPNFALPQVGVAASYRLLGGNSVIDPQEANAKANAAVQKALEIDETLAEAHAMLGALKQDEWDWAGAESELRRAIELNPNLAIVHSGYSSYLSRLGRNDAALVEIRRAQELDPLRLSIQTNEGATLYFARRYDEAIQKYQNILQKEPEKAVTISYLGYTLAAKGQYAEAIGAFQRSMSIDGENSSDQCFLGSALAKAGRRDEALAVLGKLKGTKEYVSPAELAVLYTALGDTEHAFASLEKAYAARDLQMQYLKVDPNYDALHTDPRFADLLRRVGFPQ